MEFNDGVNVIIGHNNSGKSNLLKALALVIDCKGKKRLGIDDFHKGFTFQELLQNPPKVNISVTFKQSLDEENYPEELGLVADWLTSLGNPYEAQLTYSFSLPEKYIDSYKDDVNKINGVDDQLNKVEASAILQREYLRKYVARITGGPITLQQKADSDTLKKIDFQFLDAIRDVERDMFTGRNTLLREVIRFFLDYEIKNDSGIDANDRRGRIKNKGQIFQNDSKTLVNQLLDRMQAGNKEILRYANETGASSFNDSKPGFEGNVLEEDLFATLRLVIEQANLKIPASHNGLGYNNLIFISLLLAKMQVDSDGEYLDSNAKIFPLLAIEEPEAHLHPAMQYKFLTFLKHNKRSKVRQVFLTSHSSHITSAVSLDEIICLNTIGTDVHIGYPGRSFPSTEEGRKSKAYVQRFLDATKSEMLFAKRVLMVEGIAEQLLVPVLAQKENKTLTDEHVAIVNIGGRYFHHFLYLFDIQRNPNSAISKRVACITDQDPERKCKLSKGARFHKCYPFEYNVDPDKFEYKSHGPALVNQYADHTNIRFFTQDDKEMTFEYSIAWSNPYSELLITDSIDNRDELEKLISDFEQGKSCTDLYSNLRNSVVNTNIIDSIKQSQWPEEEKKHAIFSSRYLNSVDKGENALEFAYILAENMERKVDSQRPFNVPNYIKNAIEWLCQ